MAQFIFHLTDKETEAHSGHTAGSGRARIQVQVSDPKTRAPLCKDLQWWASKAEDNPPTPGISPTLLVVQQGPQGQAGWAPNPTPAQPQPVASAWAAEGTGLSDLSV